MRYNINGRLIYDATDGTLTLPGSHEADSQLSITASALLWFFLRHSEVVSREEVLKKVWDDNGLTSSNNNLNQYLSMLRKTFRHYDIDNIIVTLSRGLLQLNPDITVDVLDAPPACTPAPETVPEPQASAPAQRETAQVNVLSPETCWYLAASCLLTLALLLIVYSFSGSNRLRPLSLRQISHSECELLASDDMLRSVSESAYVKNFDAVRQRLKLQCKPGERFLFYYGDRLQTNGLGRVFLAHCAMHGDNPFSYCDNYFYYSWKPQ